MSQPTPSVGRIVHYTLSQYDADAINKRRADYQLFRSNFSGPSEPGQDVADGHIAHIGNRASEGDVCPAMIVRVFGTSPESAANLQVFLDGNDTYWATSRAAGADAGRWSWPERV